MAVPRYFALDLLPGTTRVSLLAISLLVAGCGGQDPELVALGVPETVDYNWHVRPILSDNCFACHGFDSANREAGLRLDVRDAAVADLPESPGRRAIVPGDPDDSELIRRIVADDPDERMPPRNSHKVLTAQQIGILRQWIDDGAEYKPHWAFSTPERSQVPRADFDSRASNEIDRFVFARLEEEGLAPSPEADRETLINRVALTLTGLPPTLDEVDAFVADTSPDAYAKLVDRLLASPAYAEHMATYWLDAARYAETDGFLDDQGGRLLWPYRDWVIQSFHRNVPFDEFGTWQLAGDLLAKDQADSAAAREQTLATAFLRVGKRTTENGAIDEEYRIEYVLDRTNTIGTAFLGLTVGCAQCHDHKYDPISHRDYYSLSGFFNSIDEPGYYAPGDSGVTPGPTLAWADAGTDAKIAAAQGEAARKAAAHEALETATASRLAASVEPLLSRPPGDIAAQVEAALWDATVGHYPFETARPIPESELPELYVRKPAPPRAPEMVLPRRPDAPPPRRGGGFGGGGGQEQGPPDPDRIVLAGMVRSQLRFSPPATPGVKPAVIEAPVLRPGVKGNALWFTDTNKGFLDGDVGRFERTRPFSVGVWVHPATVHDNATVFNHRDTDAAGGMGYALHLVKNRLQFALMHTRDGNLIRIVSRYAIPAGEWTQVTVTYDGSSRAAGVALHIDGEPVAVEVERDTLTRTILPQGGTFAIFDAFTGLAFGKRFREYTLKDGAIDELQLFDRALTPLEVRFLHGGADALEGLPRDVVREGLLALAVATDVAVQSSAAEVAALRETHNVLVSSQPQIPVFGDLPVPRPTYLLGRGLYTDPQEEVLPQGLTQIFPWDEALPRNRTGLARWLFDPENPLTARVFVNRAWQMHFGRGLVETPEDFGMQSANPTHPELLDWLAVEFVESGWDVKHLHRLIVMSATYRQSSEATDELLEADPLNRLYVRGTRIRMPAEVVRDNALAASGLLIREAGGPSTYPYQPAGIWDGIGGTYPNAAVVPDDHHHRRSLYSYVKRNAPHPAMAVFDFADRNVSTVKRRTSNTPLQALALLNDPQYLEAYRKLAEQALAASEDIDSRITRVFRLATRRPPRADELETLRAFHANQMEIFRSEPEKASALISNGVLPAAATDPAALAALTNVTAAVMNSPDAYSIR